MAKSVLLTTAQVAERAGVSARTIMRWAEAGHLPIAQRLPGKTGSLLFSEAAVAAFLRTTKTRVVRSLV